MTTVIIVLIAALVISNLCWFVWLRHKKQEPSVEQPKPEEPSVDEPKHDNPEPKFKVGDWVVYEDEREYCIMQILEINTNTRPFLYRFTNSYSCYGEECLRAWDITKDAKDGDVLVGIDEDFTSAPWIGMFKCLNKNYPDRMFDSHCFLQAGTHTFISPEMESHYENPCGGHSSSFAVPATKEQRDLLFTKMAEAGYTWDAETKTLSKIEPEPEPEPTPEPVGTEEPNETVDSAFIDAVDYFSEIIPIPQNGKVYDKLMSIHKEVVRQYFYSDELYNQELFPIVYDYYNGGNANFAIDLMRSWAFAMTLAELVPEKREVLYQAAYDYCGRGAELPTYGYTFDSDPNIARMVGAVVYAINRDADIIPELRKEVGGKMLTYKNDISECYIDTTKFMPTAPPPFIKGYENRPKGIPVDADNTASMDEQINDYVAQYYNLDTKDAEKRQATIQAIANKEYHKQHLFGKDRTVTDKVYGTMTIHPVFGKHNLGIEIPADGEIANLVYDMGKICSATRISLLNQEYGRKRPGMGDTDGSMNPDERHRALVNYPIEEGDGHTTGYYDKGGYYVDGNGNYIGDYVTYYQGQLYANSYPSGHSAFIMGVGMLLMEVMPDKADLILKALIEFANGRIICRYHNQSDVTYGLIIGTMMIPVLHATTNYDLDGMVNNAKEEYQRILSGDVTPEPTPTPTEKVNTSLAYFIGGYGSCHVDAGEKQMVHRCTKQCTKERHPAIQVNQRVEFTIEGGGVTDDNGKRTGVWEANTPYGIKCPKVNEDVIATITMRNENGVRVLEYRCSKDGTHDDGAEMN